MMSPQEQTVERPQKRKKKETKFEFDPTKVTNVKAEDLELDFEMSQYKAIKGQGGDRRA